MANVLGIGGIFFKSPDPQKLVEWYARWLGFIVESASDMSFVLFQPNSIPAGGYTVWSAFKATTCYFAPSEKDFMINLMVDNVEEALQQVKEGGAAVEDDVEKNEYGRFGWFIDPDGNKVELWQPPEA